MHAQYHNHLAKELDTNENSIFLKQLIKTKAKQVEERVYWFNTVDEQAGFLEQYWQNQVHGDSVLKNRIIKITDDKLNELFADINEGKIDNDSMIELNVEAAISNIKFSQLAPEVPEFNAKYFSMDHPKTKQTKQIIRRLHQEQHQFKSRVNQIKQKEIEKKREKEQMDEEIRKSLEKEKKQKLKEHVMKTIQEKTQKQKEREEQMAKFKQFMKVYKSSKPLHVLMEEQYTQKFVLPSIEEKNKKLQQFHAKTKPSLEQINEHERNYLQNKNSRQSRVVVANQTIDVFKSRFYLQEQRKLLDGEDYQTIYDQLQKKKRYSEIVKQNFKPKISRSLRNSIQESTMKQSSARQSLDRSELVQRGKLYLQYMRSLQKNRQKHLPASERSDRYNKQKFQYQSRYVNYLQGFKQSRAVVNNDSTISRDWERDLKNKSLNDVEKRERILLKSKQLEEKAFRQEQFVSNYTYGKPEEIIEKKRQIDNNIISSIRAKVAILKDAQSES